MINYNSNKLLSFLIGFFVPFQIFTSFLLLNTPTNVIWLLGFLLFNKFSLNSNLRPFFLPLLILLIKLPLGGSIEIFLKLIVGVVFLNTISSGLQIKEFRNGLLIASFISLFFAIYQYIITLNNPFNSYDFFQSLLIPGKEWHVILKDDRDIPRVPGFMYEPAYLSMIYCIVLSIELIYVKSSNKWILLLCFIGILLSNSRIGFISLSFIMLLKLVLYISKTNYIRILYIISVFLPITPIFFKYNELINYREFIDIIDISFFARYISFIAFINEPISSILFGVINYHQTYSSNIIFSSFTDILANEGSSYDPKSLLADNLFLFGIVGSLIFYYSFAKIYWTKIRSLIIITLSNIIFFNVYAYSWPLYWIFISLAFIHVED